jgi:hypothetical protein
MKNEKTLTEFLAAFFPDENELIFLRSFHPDRKRRESKMFAPVTRRELATNRNLQSELQSVNKTHGVYFVVNAGGNTDGEITRFNAFFVENDTLPLDQQHKRLSDAPVQPSIRVETKKSVHAYWLLSGDVNAEQWRDVQKRLIAYFEGDKSIKNPSRVMRLPFFNHVTFDKEKDSYSYKRVTIAEFEPARRYSLAKMQAAYQSPSVNTNGGRGQPRKAQTTTTVGRNNTLWERGAKLKDDGLDAAQVLENLQKINMAHVVPPLDESELDEIVGNVFKYAKGNKNNGNHHGVFSKTLLDGKLTIEVDCRKSAKKPIVTARNCDSILHADEFSISDAVRRAKFVNAIEFDAADFSENAKREVLQTLINLTDSVNNHAAHAHSPQETIVATFAELDDGRVIEQITENRFAVYTAANDSFTYETSLTDAENGKTYVCDESDVFTNNELYLATELTEYGTEIELDKDIEAYLHKHVDLTPRSQTLCAKYARMTYITDKLKELPYLRGIGQSGNGKTRMCHTVGLASYRPIFSVNPTRAVLYRLIEAYKPTMILDEANFDESDDTAAMIQVLNCGFQRITSKIQRCEANAFGKQDVKFFDCFGAKIICSLEKMRSQAYESRGIEIKMFVTNRNDIDFCLSQELLDDAQIIRNKLTLWRLRNLRNDFETGRKTAQKELREKSKSKIPRSIQVATQLYALITDADSKQDFVEMLSERNATDAAQKQTTLDGEIISIIHDLLFETDADGKILKEKTKAICGKPVEVLTVKAILEKLNEDLADKEKHKREYIGKQISQKLNLATKIIWHGENRAKAAIVFDVVMLENLFKNYALPLFAEIHTCNGCNGSNCKKIDGLPLQPLNEKQGEKSATVAAASNNENNNLDTFATVATVKTPETGGDKLFDSSLLTEPNKNAPESRTQERCWIHTCRALLQGATRCPSCDQNQDDIPF